MLKRVLIACVLAILAVPVAQAGLLGTYYNLSNTHPDMETPITGFDPGYVNNALSGGLPTLTAYGATKINQFDWWNPGYAAFSRIDSDADLNGAFASSWFPIPNSLPGDPQHFAVHWTGSFYVGADQNYTYNMGSDDDSWLFIDNNLVLDLGGIHAMTFNSYNMFLTQGWHSIDIFFAERHVVQSGFQLNFFSDLQPDPVPEPATLILLGSGLVGGAVFHRRRRAKK